jgi:hypothetical protein
MSDRFPLLISDLSHTAFQSSGTCSSTCEKARAKSNFAIPAFLTSLKAE